MKALALFALLLPLSAQADPRVLVIGDSHTEGRFGVELDRELRSRPGFVVKTYGRCSTSPQHWFAPGYTTQCGWRDIGADGKTRRGKSGKTPRVTELLKAFKPEHTVIALGTNQLKRNLEISAKRVRGMIRTVKATGSGCTWVGPPQVLFVKESEQESFYGMLALVAKEEGCELVDSREVAKYPSQGGDRKHYDAFPALAREWAGHVAGKVAKHVGARPKKGDCPHCVQAPNPASKGFKSPL